jgi:hypothetical protein
MRSRRPVRWLAAFLLASAATVSVAWVVSPGTDELNVWALSVAGGFGLAAAALLVLV